MSRPLLIGLDRGGKDTELGGWPKVIQQIWSVANTQRGGNLARWESSVAMTARPLSWLRLVALTPGPVDRSASGRRPRSRAPRRSLWSSAKPLSSAWLASPKMSVVAAGGDLAHDQAGQDFAPGCQVRDPGSQVDMATEQVTGSIDDRFAGVYAHADTQVGPVGSLDLAAWAAVANRSARRTLGRTSMKPSPIDLTSRPPKRATVRSG